MKNITNKLTNKSKKFELSGNDAFGDKNISEDLKNRDSVKVLVSDELIKEARKIVLDTDAELLWKAFGDDDVKEDLKDFLRNTSSISRYILRNEEEIDYFVNEVAGLGILDSLLHKPGITDIGYDGEKLIIQTNTDKYVYKDEVSQEYILKQIEKMANAVGKDFTASNPEINLVFKNYRVSAMHEQISPSGVTMSLRVSQKRLMLNEDNFHVLAPEYVLDLFKSVVQARGNIIISGEPSTGKTELQKLLVSFIPFRHKVIMVEDVQESHVKELFPDKDIFSWVTGESKSIADLVAASLRNNPQWLIVSETRGGEAYEMFNGILSGSNIITTLHSPSAYQIPDRFINMMTQEYPNANEERMKGSILENFNLGVHLEYIDIPTGLNDEDGNPVNKRVRYAAQIVEFTPEGIQTLLTQNYINGQWEVTPQGDLSDKLKLKIAKAQISEYEWLGDRYPNSRRK